MNFSFTNDRAFGPAAASAIGEETEPKKENEMAGEDERRSSTEEPLQSEEGCEMGDHAVGEAETDDASHENGGKSFVFFYRVDGQMNK